MPIATRLTRRFGLQHPIVSAPMAIAGGGALAAAVSRAGGLGLIGAGYGDPEWIEREFRAAGNTPVGCGFITWRLDQAPHLLALALEHKPRAVFLSFGDARPYAAAVREDGVPLIVQVQDRAMAEAAIQAGADVIVAQGAEAGGHGARRGTLTLVPEIADLIAAKAPDTLLCAAGGIADGRGLAACLMLGADGAVVGSRLWASTEALVARALQDRAIAATGDDTIRQSVTDIARGYDWPAPFDIRVVRNAYIDHWLGREDEMRALGAAERDRYADAASRGDADVAAAIAGEAVGLIHSIEPAGDIMATIGGEAEALLGRAGQFIQSSLGRSG